MELTELIRHPEQMDRETLYDLRSMLALHPYFQTARLLMLQNLYLLHDAAFDEELRKAAIYITDRKTIFRMVEAAHYQLATKSRGSKPAPSSENRTVELIDTFLDSIPAEPEDEKPTRERRPTPADAAVDYVAYLLATESSDATSETPAMKGQDLIDNFLQQEQGRILLREIQQDDEPTDADESAQATTAEDTDEPAEEEEYFTETLARIYIKQGRYQKALDIIQRLSQRLPGKNAYFADQIRFLEKLIINNNNNNKNKK
ncbi:MAG: tetratricopeptide repeat protein [Prevotella sp.]|nr:tetratricopeptide repeat protein [Prevotella sp.]